MNTRRPINTALAVVRLYLVPNEVGNLKYTEETSTKEPRSSAAHLAVFRKFRRTCAIDTRVMLHNKRFYFFAKRLRYSHLRMLQRYGLMFRNRNMSLWRLCEVMLRKSACRHLRRYLFGVRNWPTSEAVDFGSRAVPYSVLFMERSTEQRGWGTGSCSFRTSTNRLRQGSKQ